MYSSFSIYQVYLLFTGTADLSKLFRPSNTEDVSLPVLNNVEIQDTTINRINSRNSNRVPDAIFVSNGPEFERGPGSNPFLIFDNPDPSAPLDTLASDSIFPPFDSSLDSTLVTSGNSQSPDNPFAYLGAGGRSGVNNADISMLGGLVTDSPVDLTQLGISATNMDTSSGNAGSNLNTAFDMFSSSSSASSSSKVDKTNQESVRPYPVNTVNANTGKHPSMQAKGDFVDNSRKPMMRVVSKFVDLSGRHNPKMVAVGDFVEEKTTVAPAVQTTTKLNGFQGINIPTFNLNAPGDVQSNNAASSNVLDTGFNNNNVPPMPNSNSNNMFQGNRDNIETSTPSVLQITTAVPIQAISPDGENLKVDMLYPPAPFPNNPSIDVVNSGSNSGSRSNTDPTNQNRVSDNNVVSFGNDAIVVPTSDTFDHQGPTLVNPDINQGNANNANGNNLNRNNGGNQGNNRIPMATPNGNMRNQGMFMTDPTVMVLPGGPVANNPNPVTSDNGNNQNPANGNGWSNGNSDTVGVAGNNMIVPDGSLNANEPANNPALNSWQNGADTGSPTNVNDWDGGNDLGSNGINIPTFVGSQQQNGVNGQVMNNNPSNQNTNSNVQKGQNGQNIGNSGNDQTPFMMTGNNMNPGGQGVITDVRNTNGQPAIMSVVPGSAANTNSMLTPTFPNQQDGVFGNQGVGGIDINRNIPVQGSGQQFPGQQFSNGQIMNGNFGNQRGLPGVQGNGLPNSRQNTFTGGNGIPNVPNGFVNQQSFQNQQSRIRTQGNMPGFQNGQLSGLGMQRNLGSQINGMNAQHTNLVNIGPNNPAGRGINGAGIPQNVQGIGSTMTHIPPNGNSMQTNLQSNGNQGPNMQNQNSARPNMQTPNSVRPNVQNPNSVWSNGQNQINTFANVPKRNNVLQNQMDFSPNIPNEINMSPNIQNSNTPQQIPNDAVRNIQNANNGMQSLQNPNNPSFNGQSVQDNLQNNQVLATGQTRSFPIIPNVPNIPNGVRNGNPNGLLQQSNLGINPNQLVNGQFSGMPRNSNNLRGGIQNQRAIQEALLNGRNINRFGSSQFGPNQFGPNQLEQNQLNNMLNVPPAFMNGGQNQQLFGNDQFGPFQSNGRVNMSPFVPFR